MVYSKKSSFKLAVKVLIAVFIATMFSGINKVMAYDGTPYFKGQYVKIGLESMMNNSITVTLNGDYFINNVIYKSGTSVKITNSNGRTALNGVEADSLKFEYNGIGNTLTIASGVNSRKYLGNMLFQVSTVRGTTGILPINTVYIEDYLRGVLPSEMSNSYHVEALKAQAVTARNYAIRNLGKYGTSYDLSDTTYDQVYKGYYGPLTNVDAAVDATKGMLLLYGTSLVDAYYSANNGGYTEDSGNVWTTSLPYYVAKPDTYNPQDNWTKTFTVSDIDTALKANKIIADTDKFTSINLNTITTYTSGRVSNIEINYVDSTGAQKTKAFSREGARTFLSLQSALYTVTFNAAASTYAFIGKGSGHGLGMSQTGAEQMALGGQKYDAILGFYYTGTQLQRATPTIASVTLSKTSVSVGESLTITANAAGGSGTGYFYWYEVSKNGVSVYNSGSLNKSSIQYTPAEAGNYVINVKVMDALSKADYDDIKTVNFSAVSSTVQPTPDGWTAKNNNWYLYKNNIPLTGWQMVSSRWYFFDSTGIMKTGWVNDGGTWYYLESSGAMVTGWKQVSGKWYYLKSSGAMVTGWTELGGKWYYLYSSGAMAYNTTIGGYKLGASGAWIK